MINENGEGKLEYYHAQIRGTQYPYDIFTLVGQLSPFERLRTKRWKGGT